MRVMWLVLAWLVAVPAAAAPPIAAYGALPGIEHAALSPSGKRLALVGVVGATRNLVVTDADGTTIVRRATLGDLKIRGIAFAGDDRVLVSVSQTEGLGPDFNLSRYEFTQVVVMDLTGKPNLAVFGGKRMTLGRVFGSYGTAIVDGRPTGYFSTVTLVDEGRGTDFRDGIPDLYRVDLQTGAIKLVSPGGSGSFRRDWLIDSDGLPLAALDRNVDTAVWKLLNLKTGREVARGVSRHGLADLVALGPTPGTIILADDTGPGDTAWSEIDMATGKATPVLADAAVAILRLDRATRRMSGYDVEGDAPRTVMFDPVHARRLARAIKGFPGKRVTLADTDAAFDTLLLNTEGPGDSGSWWRVSLSGGTAIGIGVDYPAIDGEAVAPVRMVDYTAADGLAVRGVLTLPPGRTAKSLPVVALPHGGPHARDYPGFNWWAQALASRGYAVFQPNFRGSSGLGAMFQTAGRGEWGRKMQTDISDGIAALAAQGIVDPKRACIMGASYGGYAALAGVTLQTGLYRCAVAVAGVADLHALFSYDKAASGEARIRLRTWQAEIGKGSELGAISPAKHVARADAPVLLIHGRDDTVVPFAQSEIMASRLRAAGKPVELIALAGEDHWLSKGTTRTAMLTAAVAFVEKHNPPGDPR